MSTQVLGMMRVTMLPHPFLLNKVDHAFEPGDTVAEIARELKFDLEPEFSIVMLNDRRVIADDWQHLCPRIDDHLILRNMPSKSRKSPLRTILSIVGLAASVFIPGLLGLTGVIGTIAQVGIGLVSSLVINALVPPPKQRLPLASTPIGPSSASGPMPSFQSGSIASLGGARDALVPSIAGIQNQANRYGRVMRLFGKHKIFPQHAANPYTEIVGNLQFLRCLFTCGRGPIDFSELKIGDTPIANYEGVTYEIRNGYDADTPLTLYTNDVAEDAFDLAVTAAGGVVTRTAAQDADSLSVDITFPSGLVTFGAEGGKSTRQVQVKVEYRLVGGGAWTTATTFTVKEKQTSTVRRGFKWDVANGNYEVRLTRLTADTSNSLIFDKVSWTALRAIRNVDPINIVGMTKIAIRIQATDQLSGVIDQFNVVGEAYQQVWNGSTWVSQKTRSPVWAYTEVLTGRSNRRAINKAKIDTTAMLAWDAACTAEAREFNAIVDSPTTVFELARDIASIGKASFANRNGKYTVVRDLAQATPVQYFGRYNTWGFQWSRSFHDQPQALKVIFLDPAADWQQSSRIVYDDGYDESNTDADKIEKMDLFGVTNADQAYRMGRSALGAGRLRPVEYSFNTDIENLICERGDYVVFNHDMIAAGIGTAIVTATGKNGTGDLVSLNLSEKFVMEADKNYVARFRFSDGTGILIPLVTNAGEQDLFFLGAPILSGNAMPQEEDLCLFGESGKDSIDLIITKIEPAANLSARITCRDYAGALQDIESGTFPPYVVPVTARNDFQQIPAPPIVLNTRSDEAVLYRAPDGSLESRIVVSVSKPDISVDFYQARFRSTDSDSDWIQLPPVSSATGDIFISPVEDGEVYDIKIRSITKLGVQSEWKDLPAHTVVGKTTPPPNPFAMEVQNNILIWHYTTPPLDFKGFILKYMKGATPTWDAGTRAHDGLLSDTTFDISNLGTGVTSLMLKAVDTSGNESVNAAVLVYDLGQPPTQNIFTTYDFGANNWPGTITGGTIISGEIRANDLVAMWTGSPGTPFWSSNPDNLMWNTTWSTATFEGTYTPVVGDVPSFITLDYDFEGPFTLEYRKRNNQPFWGADDDPFWQADGDLFWGTEFTDWGQWPGILPAEVTEYQFRLTVPGGKIRGAIKRFIVRLSNPDVSEFVGNTLINAGGGHVPITVDFRAIKTVVVLLHDGSAAKTWRLVSKADLIQGPELKLFDLADVTQSGTIDAMITGYK